MIMGCPKHGRDIGMSINDTIYEETGNLFSKLFFLGLTILYNKLAQMLHGAGI